MFASQADYVARLGDSEFWWPFVDAILQRHGLGAPAQDLECGVGGTFPTFLYGAHVVKLFGGWRSWAQSFRTERAMQRRLTSASQIAAPRLIADGQLFDDENAPWPYLVTTRMSGSAWYDTTLNDDERLAIAAQLGEQVRLVHRLPVADIPSHDDCAVDELVAAAKHSSLPPHLIAQIANFVAKTAPSPERVVVHSDLTPRHIFIAGGRMTGIIDWGDAQVTDRHYELAKLHLDLFDCSKPLLRRFLAASDWPLAADFPRRALTFALQRQADGLRQHHSMDVFHRVAAHCPATEIGTLDELAQQLFGI
jgi:hygromycin-B 7''-O-kinase